jgi:serine protease inhibitor
MVFLGSRGNTATQMAEAFGWSDYEGEEIHSAFKSLHEAIHSSEHDDFQLKLANRIWGQDDVQLT